MVMRRMLAALAGIVGWASVAFAGQTSIIGGDDAPFGKWPFAASVKFFHDGSYEHACTGSLIARRWVLTSARCILSETSVPAFLSAKVAIGSNNTWDIRSRSIPVRHGYVHPRFDPITYENDVGLLELTYPVNDIKPVSIVSSVTVEGVYAPPGTNAVVMGWGQDPKAPDTGIHNPLLQQLPAQIRSRSVCNRPDYYNGKLKRSMVCAGVLDSGKGFCLGDQGAPLVVVLKSGKILQVGLASFGYTCDGWRNPGVYTRLAVVAPWIQHQIAKK